MKEDQAAVTEDSAEELEESSDNTSESFGPEEQELEEPGSCSETLELQGSQPPPPCGGSPSSPSPAVAPKVPLAEYHRRTPQKRPQKGSLCSTFRGKILKMDASPAEQMYKKSAFAMSAVEAVDFLGEEDPDRPSVTTDDPSPRVASPTPVVNCPLAVTEVEVLGHDNLQVNPLQVVVKEEAGDVETRLPSNEADPIVIDSDEDDHLLSAARARLPSDTESELSEGPVEESTDVSSEKKVSAQKALRIQLKAISKGKLSLNRGNLRKSRELEIKNMKLMQELATQRMLCQQYSEKLSSHGLGPPAGGTTDYPSPSAGPSQQATTSIASAPEMSVSAADLRAIPPTQPREDFIPGTQVCTSYRFYSVQSSLPNHNKIMLVLKKCAQFSAGICFEGVLRSYSDGCSRYKGLCMNST